MNSWSPEIVLVIRRLREDPEVVWGPGGRGGARRTLRPYRNPEVSSLDPEIFDWNPKEPGGSSLDHEIFDRNPEATGEPGGSSSDFTHRTRNRVGNRGDHTPPLATTGTCLDFAFCRSEAGHYRVPMLYSTSAGSHWQILEGAGVGVMTQVPGFAAFHVWRSRILIAPYISQ
ncbi:hypothetical protein F2Q68_00016536 [Brassica cretica]|uniref:Uncharacterized protein n=1 Tax=Brassica cretica TaxID=69181 RepID=A0A8S9HHL6_BRACR|nr:hypothetical protein F2Q68_00016536 [Brassica cretica]